MSGEVSAVPAVVPVETKKPKLGPRKHMAAGFSSGLASAVLLQPLDLLKTRMQQQTAGGLLKTIAGLDGISALWRGTLPSALRTSIGSALYLTTLSSARGYVAAKKSRGSTNSTQYVSSSALPKLGVTENLAIGAAARSAVGFVAMPLTVLKVRYESTLYRYTSLASAVADIWKREGLRGFFAGFGATTLRDAPYAGLYVLLYEKLKVGVPVVLRFSETGSGYFSHMTSAFVNTGSAATAAGLATALTGPFDVIKTRMQLQPGHHKSFLGTGLAIARQEGFRHLFDGLSLRLTRKMLAAGISWCIYEELLRLF